MLAGTREGDQRGQTCPFCLCSQEGWRAPGNWTWLEGTWELDVGLGSGMGREEEVSWLVSSTQQTLLSSTSPVPPTTTSCPQAA